MSGSASLAAAKRRRAGPSVVNNEVPKRQTNNVSNNTQSINNLQTSNINSIGNTHPLIILANHEQQLNILRSEIDLIHQNSEQQTLVTSSSVDEESIQFFKSRYESVIQEMEEMKKLLIKIQTFSMETNLELLKMKRLLKNDPRIKENDDENLILDNLSLNES